MVEESKEAVTVAVGKALEIRLAALWRSCATSAFLLLETENWQEHFSASL
jgi:hypothetical protein